MTFRGKAVKVRVALTAKALILFEASGKKKIK